MSVIIVSKKAHETFKKYSIIFGIIATVSITGCVYLGYKAIHNDQKHQAATEQVETLTEQLRSVLKQNSDLADKLEKKKIAMIAKNRDVECLATNIYFEAGGEPYEGKVAVANVVANRMAHPQFPKSACGVVYQGSNTGKTNCQFSWACDGREKAIKMSSQAWADSQKIAIRVLAGVKADITNGALYFHNTDVRPRWATSDKFVRQIGRHLFYR